jgi:hypothetical protein
MFSVRDFGARGDGLTDDTAALSHAVQRGDGHLVFPRGDYVLTQPLYVPLHLHGRIGLDGCGGTARLLMRGPGPALYLVGTHRRTAHPDQFADTVWLRERMPTVRDLEIVGEHAQADGIRIDGVMQPTLQGVLIRRCRHGVHLTNRARNVLIASCHIYNNTGVGVFFDRVNLHQTNIHGSHISYCRQGGIKIAGSEIRNLQICSNDIEYNYDLQAMTSADVLFDCRDGTVREGTIVGNTIQAVESPGGANVRFLGAGPDNPNAVGLFTLSGNLLGSQQTVLDLRSCRGVVVSGNTIYSGYQHAVWAEDAEHLVFSGNSIDHNPEYRGRSTDRLVFIRCRNVTLNGTIIQHTREAAGEVQASVEIQACQNVQVSGCQVINARTRGLDLRGSSVVHITGCTLRGRAGDQSYREAIRADAACARVLVTNNFLGQGIAGTLDLPRDAGTASGNVTV